ncbi:MAG: outer membrane beta-barrel protein [Flavobacteriales bacterium]
MKKVLIALCAVALGTTAMAQTDQGGWMFGAGSNLGFTSSKDDNDQEDAVSNFSLDARAGYFVIDNLAIGLDIGFSSTSVGDQSSSSFNAGPYVRYYLPMKIFAEVGYQFGSQKTTIDLGPPLGSVDVTYGTGALGIGVGYAAFLNDNVSIEPMIKYSMTSLSPEEGDAVNGGGFGVLLNFGIYLGN